MIRTTRIPEPPRRSKASLRKRVFRTIMLCAALYLLACLGCARFQRRLIYFPPVFPPERVDELARSENLERWMSPLLKPVGWMRRSPTQPAQGQVLITHGNACCAFQCAYLVDAIQQTAPFDVFVVEFPGYADRPGTPTERTLDDAAAEAIQLLSTNTPLYLVGESLGTGVAAYLAGLYPEKVAGIALLAPYSRLADVAQAHIRILPVRLLLRDRFPAEDYLHNYHGPLAVLVGGQDSVVPKRFGLQLYNNYSGPKHLWEFPQATHDSLMFQPPAVWKQIIAFWQSNCPPATLPHSSR